jgi:hypothetical protein
MAGGVQLEPLGWCKWSVVAPCLPTTSLLDSMLHKYGITFIHRASQPNPQEPPDSWALAARVLTLVQLGVGLVLRLCVCERQG